MEFSTKVHPEPKLLPVDPLDRAYVRAFSAHHRLEIHPLNNLRTRNTSAKRTSSTRGVNPGTGIGSPRVSR